MRMNIFEAFATGMMLHDLHSISKTNRNQGNQESLPPKKPKTRKPKTFNIGNPYSSEPVEGAFSEILDQLIDGDTVQFMSDIRDVVTLKTEVYIEGNGYHFYTSATKAGLNILAYTQVRNCHFVCSEGANSMNVRSADATVYLAKCTFEHSTTQNTNPSFFSSKTNYGCLFEDVTMDNGVINTNIFQGNNFKLGSTELPKSQLTVNLPEGDDETLGSWETVNTELVVRGHLDKLAAVQTTVKANDGQLEIGEFTVNVLPYLKPVEIPEVLWGLSILSGITIKQVVAPVIDSPRVREIFEEHGKLFNVNATKDDEVLISGAWPYANHWVNMIHSGHVICNDYQSAIFWYLKSENATISGQNTTAKFKRDYKPKPKPKTAQDKLNEMIGLQEVKKKVNTYIATNLVNKKRRELGQPVAANSLHLIFSGSAGTGKTQVARLLGQILYDNGIIAKSEIKEITAKDLIGEYTGQTSPKTHQAIMEAKGGILFIDEAYELNPEADNGGAYKREAITTLVKDMDDMRSDLIVIMAGYTEKMEELLTANEGLPSRVVNKIEFSDYSADELLQIAKLQLAQLKQTLDEDAESRLTEYVNESAQTGRVNGNGRWVRNLLQFTSQARDVRIVMDGSMEKDASSMNRITLADVEEGIASM